VVRLQHVRVFLLPEYCGAAQCFCLVAKAGAQHNELACSHTSIFFPHKLWPFLAAERDEVDSERRLTSLPEPPRLSKITRDAQTVVKPINTDDASPLKQSTLRHCSSTLVSRVSKPLADDTV
jgi:hypothetical protein